jgi:uncharacterized protein
MVAEERPASRTAEVISHESAARIESWIVDTSPRIEQSDIMRLAKYIVVFASVLLGACLEQASAPAPENSVEVQSSAPAIDLTGRVTDQAGIFSDAQEMAIADKLERLEQATGHQMVVATVSSLKGRELEPFTTDLANAWGIGREGYDDGVVILIAPNERMVRIAVGYGLKGTLTDDLCEKIIQNAMLPNFREGDFFNGTDLGVDALIDALQ